MSVVAAIIVMEEMTMTEMVTSCWRCLALGIPSSSEVIAYAGNTGKNPAHFPHAQATIPSTAAFWTQALSSELEKPASHMTRSTAESSRTERRRCSSSTLSTAPRGYTRFSAAQMKRTARRAGYRSGPGGSEADGRRRAVGDSGGGTSAPAADKGDGFSLFSDLWNGSGQRVLRRMARTSSARSRSRPLHGPVPRCSRPAPAEDPEPPPL